MNNSDGFCECGCGQLAPLATRTRASRGQIKGEPISFIYKHQNIGRSCDKDVRNKISMANKGKKRSKECIKNNRLRNLGKKLSLETRIKMSECRKGNKSHLWKGGITAEHKAARQTLEYKHWIKLVFERDNYTCQKCGDRGVYLHSHHIKSFAKYPELRIILENGITWCEDCHYNWHKEHGFR